MKIERLSRWNGGDFHTMIKCEYCGYVGIVVGRDFDTFRDRLLPKMQCPDCKKASCQEGGKDDNN